MVVAVAFPFRIAAPLVRFVGVISFPPWSWPPEGEVALSDEEDVYEGLRRLRLDELSLEAI